MRTRTRGRAGVVGLMLGVSVACAALAGAPATFTISRETTFFTQPVRADGTVDYVEAINARLGEGVRTADNAAVPLLEGAALSPVGRAEHYAKVRAKLGVAAPPPRTKTPGAGAAEPFAGAEPKNLDQAKGGPWTAEQLPEVAAWLKRLEPRLTLMIEASRRGQFYMPLVRERDDDPMTEILLPHLAEQRDLSNALAARAMLALGNEDGEAFRRDVVAIVRLGRVSTHAATMLERYCAIHFERIGLDAIQAAASGGWLSAEQAERLLADLRAGPAALPLHEVFDLAERGSVLELLQACAVHGNAVLPRFLRGTNVTLPAVATATPAEWDTAMRTVNRWHDRARDACRQPAFADRAAAISVVEADLAAVADRKVAAPVAPEAFANRVLSTVSSPVAKTDVRMTSIGVDRDLAEAALALSAFRAKSGEYPQALKELVPAYFKAEPIDPFTGRTLVYHVLGGGYVLQSLGPNGQDDTGKVGAANDDVVVRAER
jgi:hypothetical protein